MRTVNQRTALIGTAAWAATACSLLGSCSVGSHAATESHSPAALSVLAVDSDPAQYATPWAPPGHRRSIEHQDIAFRNQDGRAGVVREIFGKPAVITCFYTRCQNGAKCSAAVGRLAGLQRKLRACGLNTSVRLVAVSYEPQFDTPDRLNRFGADRGLAFGEDAQALQLDAERAEEFIHELQAPVNYNAGWVNTHGVELTLLDRNGGVARKYHTVLWDDDVVIADIRRVLAE